jgi:metallo-beta-lactamase family protein
MTTSSSPTITFLGAAGTVTGSKFLLTAGDTRVLVDCGLFQGLKELRLKNWEPLDVDPATIDAVVLTHAHLDHCGYLPRLVKDGFRGRIHTTANTAKLAEVILRDSARIQVEDAEYAAKKKFSKHNPPKPLYDEQDAGRAIALFTANDFGVPVEVAAGVSVTFHPAGHILGAAVVDITIAGKRIVFSGDLGRNEHPLLCAPTAIPAGSLDAVVIESTYGDRQHETPTDEFATVISETVSRGGSVLIPAFAVDRTEIILIALREMMEAGSIPKLPIFADSPMALKALDFYRDAIDTGTADIRPDVRSEWAGRDPFDPGTLKELVTVDESKTINNPTQPCIIISASGMGTGGRVVHHLREMLPNPLHTVILVGYQAIGTRGRALVDGAESVRMHGREVPVKARIEQIQSFSVHADGEELVAWLKTATDTPEHVFVVHGESGVAETFAQHVQQSTNWNAHAPVAGETVAL